MTPPEPNCDTIPLLPPWAEDSTGACKIVQTRLDANDPRCRLLTSALPSSGYIERGLVADAGEAVAGAPSGYSLHECQTWCDSLGSCLSFSFLDGACWLKAKCVTFDDPQNDTATGNGWRTWYTARCSRPGVCSGLPWVSARARARTRAHTRAHAPLRLSSLRGWGHPRAQSLSALPPPLRAPCCRGIRCPITNSGVSEPARSWRHPQYKEHTPRACGYRPTTGSYWPTIVD